MNRGQALQEIKGRYAEYLKSDTWQAGYSARVDINPDGTTDAVWLERWKQENNCPW